MRILEFFSSSAKTFIFSISTAFINKKQQRIGFLCSFIILFGLVPIAVFSASTPEFQLPDPTGPYAVGTQYFYFVDENQPDTYTSDPDDYREVSLQVWYPAVLNGDEEPIHYWNDQTVEFIAKKTNAPPDIFRVFAAAKTHSYLNAQLDKAEAPYPVVLYSPTDHMVENTALFEELASNGYIVLSIGHPYWPFLRFDKDGNTVFFDGNNEHHKEMWEEENSSEANAIKEEITGAAGIKEKEDAQRRLNQCFPKEIADIRLWSGDIHLILDRLGEMNRSNELFAGKLNLAEIGYIGFSKGGASVGQFCVIDKRCKAGVNLSGFMFGDIIEKHLTQPFMFLESVESWCKDCLPVNELFYRRVENEAYILQIKDAMHTNFSDWSLYEKMKDKGAVGPIDGRRFLKIQNTYVLAFFNKYLKNIPVPLLDGPSIEYPEVIFKSRHP